MLICSCYSILRSLLILSGYTSSHPNYLDVVADITGVVYDGEGWLPQLQLGRVVVGVGLVLALKLLEEGVVVGIGKAGCRDAGIEAKEAGYDCIVKSLRPFNANKSSRK